MATAYHDDIEVLGEQHRFACFFSRRGL
jgi:hypothetical protein